MARVSMIQAQYFQPGVFNKNVGCSELAQILRVTEQRVIQLTKEGLPRSGHGSYPLKECVGFYIDKLKKRLDENQNDTIIIEKIRLTRAKAKKAEIDAEKAGGNVLNKEQAKQNIMVLALEIKEEFLALPGREAPFLEEKSAGEIKTALTIAVTAALNRVSVKIRDHKNE